MFGSASRLSPRWTGVNVERLRRVTRPQSGATSLTQNMAPGSLKRHVTGNLEERELSRVWFHCFVPMTFGTALFMLSMVVLSRGSVLFVHCHRLIVREFFCECFLLIVASCITYLRKIALF